MSGGDNHKMSKGGEATSPPLAVELRNISKTFGAVKANSNISLQVKAGTIHGIVGENGAGKSTLMNILFGLHRADQGEIAIHGQTCVIKGSADAISRGIGMVHQHFMLVPNFTVLENVMLGSEGSAFLKNARRDTLKLLNDLSVEYGMNIDPHALIEDLTVGERQWVEILKSLKTGADILILDEPTGVLTPQEADNLFAILRRLREAGKTVLVITHKLAEIMAITDEVSIMRHGQMIKTLTTSLTSPQQLAEIMVGRAVLLQVDRGISKPGEVAVAVNDLSCVSPMGHELVKGVSFSIRTGEILGVAGVAGNGQSELLEMMSGMRSPDGGSIQVFDHEISEGQTTNPEQMRSKQTGHIPEDRHRFAMMLDFEACENGVLGFQRQSRFGAGHRLNRDDIISHCGALMDEFDVRPANPNLNGKNFSGGNQQKLVIAREVEKQPKFLIVGQPTRGVDIGAIEFIHQQLIDLRDAGCAILLVSVELDEVLGLSDRIMVMNAGHCVGIIDREEASEQALGLMMAGIGDPQASAQLEEQV